MNKLIVGQVIGEGSYAQVREATTSDGKKVVIKQFSEEDEFKRERDILMQMTGCSFVTQLLATTELFNCKCIVFHRMTCDLYHYIYRMKGTMYIKHFLKQLLLAMVFMQEKNIVHCDIKPQNILVDSNGSGSPPIIKLADFGLAMVIGSEDYLLRENQEIQTIWYRSIDEVFGHERTHKTDIWSLGCILTEMTIHEPLFSAMNEIELILQFNYMFGGIIDRLLVGLKTKMFFLRGFGSIEKVISSIDNTKTTNVMIDLLSLMSLAPLPPDYNYSSMWEKHVDKIKKYNNNLLYHLIMENGKIDNPDEDCLIKIFKLTTRMLDQSPANRISAQECILELDN